MVMLTQRLWNAQTEARATRQLENASVNLGLKGVLVSDLRALMIVADMESACL